MRENGFEKQSETFNLLHYHKIPGHEKALQDTFWCPYSVAYSTYKPTLGANTNENLNLNILYITYSIILLPIVGLVGAIGHTVGTCIAFTCPGIL